ncbi:gliding motility-associated C-terminal domain-containing protein [Mangrovimonas sp. TPBH4]|uniref:T9SS type B sorting domain-containing protein n=1 Tax=Mangrovimonas sp. TPBH4 TaxID=1645914 RepID=UPI0006B505E5|nr:gliding motility-associated C-terminal domain-containing protein [Mangrovimonas sp. TPBH4]
MQKTTILNRLAFLLGICVWLCTQQTNAQLVIGTPNLGFSQACASESFNTYNVTFVFSPETVLEASNQFILEMSDPDGDFSNPTTIFTSQPGAVTVSPATLSFSLPSTTAGEGYKLRIKSTAPVATSAKSAAFAAYYKIQDSPFSINNLVSTGAFCSGGSYLLTIDNPGTGENDSPLNYPSLTFNWFRETSPTTAVFISQGPTLSVNQEGTYFAETNYGTCTSNSFSNRVSISEVSAGEADATIASSLGNPFCPDQGMTTLATIGGVSYQWYKDGAAISGATEQTYQTNESGFYSVEVDLGSCETSGSIDLISESFESEINIPEENQLEEGDYLWVQVTTTANNPVYEWYFNGTLIPDVTGEEYEAYDYGSYKVVITQTTGCETSQEFTFTIGEPIDPFPEVGDIPNLISPNGDGINDTWVIPQQYVSGSNTEIVIMDSRGKVVHQTNNYMNNWPENQLGINSINQVFYYIITSPGQDSKKGSITVVK